MSYTKAEQLYEGKAKKVFAIKENPDYVMVSYKDDATAFNGLKKGQIHGKGVINDKLHVQPSRKGGYSYPPG